MNIFTKQYEEYKGENKRHGTLTIEIDNSRDNYMTPFGRATMTDRYIRPGETIQMLFARVAVYFADNKHHAQRLYDYMSKHWFMPATPILSNGGTDRGMPISCFLNEVNDSLDSIADVFNENLWLASRGGGIGTSWSNVRSIGERIGENGQTSGIIPFIHQQDSATIAISQGSLRRGSSAAYLHVSHPEIEEFVEMRKPTGGDIHRKNLNIHHGVLIPDDFMRAVEAGHSWNLVSPRDGSVKSTVSARDLWQRILTMRLETGEPYVIYIDEVNRQRPAIQKKLGLEVSQSNLCAEITLPTGTDHLGNDRTAVCCLSSLNFERFDEWNGNTVFMKDVLCFLDNVLQDFIERTQGVKGFERARYSAMRERSVGLGVMGFHSYLQKKMIPFESAMAHSFNMRAFSWVSNTLSDLNIELGYERGSCLDAIDAGVNQPQRFSNMMAVAPTASISIIAGGSSAGIEPWNGNAFNQKTLSGSFEVRNKYLDNLLHKKAVDHAPRESYFEIVDDEHKMMLTPKEERDWVENQWSYIMTSGGSVQHLDYLTQDEKDVFKTAFEIDQRWVIDHAASRAPFICQAQSVNIFLEPDAHKRDLHFLHHRAWKKGLKSLYYCRSKSSQRAETVSHMAGEMPQARPVIQLRVDYDEECLSCQ